MKPFSLLIKPASADCNLRCEYCFYIDHLEEGILVFKENWELQDYIEDFLRYRNLDVDQIRFQLLKKLIDLGDYFAKKVFKKEVAKQIEKDLSISNMFLLSREYLRYFDNTEVSSLIYEGNGDIRDFFKKPLNLEKKN